MKTSFDRKNTRAVRVGQLSIGGGAPIHIQSMTNTDTHDVDATYSQVMRLAEAGADIVVGTHPHVLQPIEFRKDGRLVFWSLGNFVSGQRTLPRERTVVAAVDIEADETGACRVTQVGVVPAAVLKVPVKGREAASGFVIVPAGMENARPEAEAKRAAAVHRDVLKFLKLAGSPRADGFWAVPQAE